jgi:hypothetical protein
VLTAVVVIETMVLALLSVVVVALLRSHAEVLRRLPAADEDHEHDAPEPIPIGRLGEEPRLPAHLPGPRGSAARSRDIAGATPNGDAVVISMSSGVHTLLAFLSTGCLTCRTFWEGLRPSVRRPLPGDARVIVVVKDRGMESPSKLRELAPPDVPVVHSSQAWEDFEVGMSPYFCFVDGATGEVRSEGAAMSWDQVSSLLRDALMDEELARREA